MSSEAWGSAREKAARVTPDGLVDFGARIAAYASDGSVAGPALPGGRAATREAGAQRRREQTPFPARRRSGEHSSSQLHAFPPSITLRRLPSAAGKSGERGSTSCHSAWGPNANRRGKLLNYLSERGGVKL